MRNHAPAVGNLAFGTVLHPSHAPAHEMAWFLAGASRSLETKGRGCWEAKLAELVLDKFPHASCDPCLSQFHSGAAPGAQETSVAVALFRDNVMLANRIVPYISKIVIVFMYRSNHARCRVCQFSSIRDRRWEIRNLVTS